jgi:hypothetical protein
MKDTQFRLEAHIRAIPTDLNLPCMLFSSDGPDMVMTKVDDMTLKNVSTGDQTIISVRKTTNKVLLDPDTLTLDDAKKYLASGFTWGEVKTVHVVGDYQIIEYHPRKTENNRVLKDIDYEQVAFHPYIDWKDTNRGFGTLEEAMVGVIALRFDGLNSQAAMYFSKMVGLTGTYDD